ncbi:hypothetical protein O6H91_05G080300 [Diphasiastrum complanatum]|nr:hypothetical protein O6H91_05G080300 [Diphasiastrum complanatum]
MFLSTLRKTLDMSERRRLRSGFFLNGADGEVICPKPRRLTQIVPSTDCVQSSRRHCSEVSHADGDAGFEILDIFLSKGGSLGCSPPYFCGSPPNRSGNPLVHDVQFNHQRASPSCVPMQQASHRLSPSVRVEGFAISAVESRCSVSARA